MTNPSTKPSRRWISPLRYPGGKVRMAESLVSIFGQQWGYMDVEVWVEPFAGGAGAGLKMLYLEGVESLWLVEKNPSLAALWRHILEDGETFAKRVQATSPTLDLWTWAKTTIAAVEAGDGHVPEEDIAYAAFLVNRLSRSGIVSGNVGPIGGKRQAGRWNLASRYNGDELAHRIRLVHDMSSRIVFHEADAINYIAELSDSGVEEEVMLFVDPPYIEEGAGLYEHGTLNHAHLAHALRNCPSHWLLTYDAHPYVLDLYHPDYRVLEFEIAHTAHQQRIDTEYAVLSDNLYVGDRLDLLRGEAGWVAEGGVREGQPVMAPMLF